MRKLLGTGKYFIVGLLVGSALAIGPAAHADHGSAPYYTTGPSAWGKWPQNANVYWRIRNNFPSNAHYQRIAESHLVWNNAEGPSSAEPHFIYDGITTATGDADSP